MNLKKLLLFLAAPLMLVLTGCESTPIVPTYADCQVVDAEGNAITSVNFSAEQGSQKILVKATRSWTISNTAEWFAVNPVSYNNRDNSEQTTEVTIDVFANDGEARSQAISIACGDLKPVEITVAQAGQGQTALGEVLYYDNFDKKDAAKGSDGYYPYMSADYGNPTPESQSGVTYTSHNVTARNNSNSNGSYSDCASEASGANNIFFGKAPNYLTISGISLAALEGNALTLKFATEKYSQDNGSKFTESEFRVYISADGAKWSEIDYTFAGTAEGRWNIATAQFNLKEVPSTVSLYFTASVASSYRLDDVKLIAGGGGAEIDLAAGTAIDGSGNTGGDNTGGDNGGTSGGTVDATIPEGAVVWNIGAANQTWAAETHATLGAGFSATVDNLKVGCYKYNSTTAIVTAKDDHFRVYKNSAFVIEPLDGRTITKVVMLCTDPANYDGSVTHYTFDLSVSDGSTAVSDQTAKAISWTGNTAKFEAYAVNGQVRIKTLAVVLDGEGSGTVTPEPEPEPTPDPEPTPGEIAKVTVAEFLQKEVSNDVWYELTGVISNVASTIYGNFNLVDETGSIYVYGLTATKVASNDKSFASLGLKEGDTVTIIGNRAYYEASESHQVGNAYYVSHVSAPVVEGDGKSATISFADVANRTSFSTSQQVWEQNGIKVTNDKGASTSNVADYSSPARFYKSSNLTIEAEKEMSEIVVYTTGGSKYYLILSDGTGYTVTGSGTDTTTITLTTPAKSFTITSLAQQTRCTSIKVTFAE